MQEDKSPNERNKKQEPGCLPAILVWGGFFLVILLVLILKETHATLATAILFCVVFSIPAYCAIGYILEKGKSAMPYQALKLLIGLAAFMFLGFVLTQCSDGGSSEMCAYRVGCW